jgi:hypothetical protein
MITAKLVPSKLLTVPKQKKQPKRQVFLYIFP